MHKTLFHLHKLLLHFCIHHSICPFREQPLVSLDVLPFSLIECNSIPYNFLLKTHILLFFSNRELSCILAFYRLVNINTSFNFFLTFAFLLFFFFNREHLRRHRTYLLVVQNLFSFSVRETFCKRKLVFSN